VYHKNYGWKLRSLFKQFWAKEGVVEKPPMQPGDSLKKLHG